MKLKLVALCILTAVTMVGYALAEPLGLPPVPIPADNPQTPDKIQTGRQAIP